MYVHMNVTQVLTQAANVAMKYVNHCAFEVCSCVPQCSGFQTMG